jgi:hypothetical protein
MLETTDRTEFTALAKMGMKLPPVRCWFPLFRAKRLFNEAPSTRMASLPNESRRTRNAGLA